MNHDAPAPVVAVLGASGLIGEALCTFLLARGETVVPVARRFTPVQDAAWGGRAVRCPLVEADVPALRAMLRATGATVVVNCVGALQDAPGAPAAGSNRDFVSRLAEAMSLGENRAPLLVHISIPGAPDEDRTDFSRAKREAEGMIARSGLAYAILRPGFVVGETAFGGSALLRALAMLPVDLPADLAARPFAVTDASDIGRTVAFLLDEWRAGRRSWQARWDVMARDPQTVGGVLAALAQRLAGPRRRIAVPGWLLGAGARAGDLASQLGWRPPVRSTALAEMRRGVAGDTASWRAATGLEPRSGPRTLAAIGAGVQERWFARLYMLKALVFTVLPVFWIVSGLIAVSVAFGPAVGILTDHGFPATLAKAVTVATSLMDISVGVLVAWRRTARLGLLAGIALSLFYMVSAAFITPDMWIEPLGALVKTGPAIVLMMVALAILDDR